MMIESKPHPTARILGISGSLRQGSYNLGLLKTAAGPCPGGAELQLFGGLAAIPPFNEDEEARPPPAVTALRRAIADDDCVLVDAPEYNQSIPGQLKNVLDWASRPRENCVLDEKPVAVIGASPSPFGAGWSHPETRKVLAAAGARVVEAELAAGRASTRFDARGRLVDAKARCALAAVVSELGWVARAHHAARAVRQPPTLLEVS
jgi:chromate reductase, NAD(P)H dehydrogenase (quinone)